MGKGGNNGIVGKASERVMKVKPGDVDRALVPSCIIQDGLQQKGVFVAPLPGAGALLFI